MKVLLIAINAKYIHSNLAVYDLKAYAEQQMEKYNKKQNKNILIEIVEYTINQLKEEILADVFEHRPDVAAFSCYIWNIEFVKDIIADLTQIMPNLPLWMGGPEVSFDSKRELEKSPRIKGIMCGEGEKTFSELVNAYMKGLKDSELDDCLERITGLTFRRSSGEIISTGARTVMDLNEVPFIYENLSLFTHKILYYESSRGCPFSCSYCLSSIDKKLRFRNLDKVKEELQVFLDANVPQVKFVDRTFNCKPEHSREIWRYIMAHDNGVTNFHFEISADLLKEEDLRTLQKMRPGLVQLETGVQSTNPETLKEIRRNADFGTIAANVLQMNDWKNIHQHLDLIAGLPYEDLASFQNSFDEVYKLHPSQLQLGFLKVLKGSLMEEKIDEYGLGFRSKAPYEVLFTKWMSYEDIHRLKWIEEMVEVYYNSGQFVNTLALLETVYDSAFSLYRDLALFYREQGWDKMQHNRQARYEHLLFFTRKQFDEMESEIRETLIFDFYLRENAKSRPTFAQDPTVSNEEIKLFCMKEKNTHRYLEGYETLEGRQIARAIHLERFSKKGLVLFDYCNRNPVDNSARVITIDETIDE